jgi:hypothetical protein
MTRGKFIHGKPKLDHKTEDKMGLLWFLEGETVLVFEGIYMVF